MGVQTYRLVKDASLVVTKAIPAAGSNTNSGTIDLGVGPYRQGEVMIEVAIPAMSAHTDSTKSVTIKIQDSADNVTFADIDPLQQTAVAGVTTTGSAAKTVYFRLPPGARRYIQFNIAETSAGPDLTGSSITFSLTF